MAITNSMKRDFNADWRFALEDSPETSRVTFDDQAWRTVHLPHDWSVESSFDRDHGDGATAYLPGGVGWYRKRFATPKENADGLLYVLFDGIYNNADVWLNGKHLRHHPYGYSPFYDDITPHLQRDGSENVLAVRVDRSRYVDSRWYSGSGIYRHVSLISKDRLHIPIWGTFLTTPQVSSERATVNLEIKVNNTRDTPCEFELLTTIYDQAGDKICERRDCHRQAGEEVAAYTQNFEIESPDLWGVDNPAMYNAKTVILQDGEAIDTHVTPFGIRSIRFDPETGFYLNGVNTLLKGVCLHHDAGLVGAAVPEGVWERRLATLKELGCNAIRTAHNPPSEEFLDLCDRMGFLVQDEFFDEWDNPKDKRKNQNEQHDDYISRGYAEQFQEHAEADLKVTMLRDRNHPCIFMWSIGNEIEWTYPRYEKATGYWDSFAEDDYQPNYFWDAPPISPEAIAENFNKLPVDGPKLADTARKLADWTRQMDSTRPVTANLILPEVSHLSGYTDALDVIGYSYRQVLYGYCHELYPDKMLYGAENFAQWHEWKSVLDNAYIPGIFLWTGIDYMGEAHNKWPVKGTLSGALDFAGFIKPSGHMMKTLWNDEPHIHIATQLVEQSLYDLNEVDGSLKSKDPDAWKKALWFWHDVNHHWDYQPGQTVAVELYTNCQTIELFLNGNSLGMQSLADHEDHILKWAVPFEPGTLEARSVYEQQATDAKLVTATEASAIELTADRSELRADGYDVVHLVAQVVDAEGNPVRSSEKEISFDVQGDARLLGVDNGAGDNVQDYQSDRLTTSQGRALAIIQAGRTPGRITVTARCGETMSTEVAIHSE